MKAELLLHQRIEYGRFARRDGVVACSIASTAVWPQAEVLALLWPPGVREVGYDNERGKGDHRHLDVVETACAFTSVEKLLADFWLDVRTKRGKR